MESSLEQCYAWWRSFDVKGKRAVLNQQALDFATRQDASTEARKVLMEAVKDFRRLSDVDKGAASGALLKSMQDEIDALSRRARFAEKAFGTLAQDIMEAPDPAPPLAAALEAARASARLAEENARLASAVAATTAAAARGSGEAAAEMERLRVEVRELEIELGKLSNQDITIRELESRLGEFEASVETTVGARLAERESELRRVFDAELEGVREAETAAEGRVAALAAALAEAAAARDVAQAALYSLRSRAGGAVGGDDAGAPGAAGGGGGASGSAHAELSLLAADNERLAARSAALASALAEARREVAAALAPQAASAAGDADDGAAASARSPLGTLRASAAADRARARAAEEELTNAAAALEAVHTELREAKAAAGAAAAEAEARAAASAAQVAAAEGARAAAVAELMSRPTAADVAALRAQIATLQVMAFSAVEEEENADAAVGGSPQRDGGSTGAAIPGGGDIASMMLRRIRHLDARLLHAEERREAAEADAAAAKDALEAARELAADRAALVERLEEEIALRTASATDSAGLGSTKRARALGGISGTPSGQGGDAADDHPTTPRRKGAFDEAADAWGARRGAAPLMSPDAQLSSLLDGPNPAAARQSPLALQLQPAASAGSVSADGSSTAAPTTAAGGSDPQTSSLVAILQGQRDRFRQRSLELEAELTAANAAGDALRGRVAALTADNVKLYEKTRFLQSYGAGGSVPDDTDGPLESAGGTAGSAFLRGAGRALRARAVGGAQPAEDDDFERPYRALYAETIDPLAEFHKRERARGMSRLSPSERIALSSSQLFLASRTARNFAIVYIIVMHLLMFATLWHFSHVSHKCGGDSRLDSTRVVDRFVSTALRGALGPRGASGTSETAAAPIAAGGFSAA